MNSTTAPTQQVVPLTAQTPAAVTNAGARAAYESTTGETLSKPPMGGGYTLAKAVFFVATFLMGVAALAGIAAGSAALATQSQLALVCIGLFAAQAPC